MISSVYSYYLSQYGHKPSTKYDSLSKTQLKNTYSKVMKANSHTPTYKVDISEEAQRYAIDLKENARELRNITAELSNSSDGTMTFKKAAISSDEESIFAEYVGDGDSDVTTTFDIEVRQLATGQVNNGNFLPPNSKVLETGDYSFDLNINNLTYEFQFSIDEGESNNDIQQKISRLINRSNIGLSSKINEDSLGNTAISIASDATGLTEIKPVIFNIRPNNDDQSNNPDFVEGFDQPTNKKNTSLVNTLGLDRISQYPSNALFSINGDERSSPSNRITINKAFSLELKKTTEAPVNISLMADTDSVVESINELVTGYNRLVAVATDDKNTHFDGNSKLQKEISNIAKSYKYQLEDNGLTVSADGSIGVNRDAVLKTAENGSISEIFNTLDAFKKSVQQKAEDISINPMNYVNNKIVAYKNPNRTITDPYNLSAYTGMMFNGYT